MIPLLPDRRFSAYVFDAYGTLYDTQSVMDRAEQFFPQHGEALTQIWRLKQLEYSWLRTAMENYSDFWVVTRDALIYALRALSLKPDDRAIESLMDFYLHLKPYPETRAALEALQPTPCFILSNGSTTMLSQLVMNSGLDRLIQRSISVDEVQRYKPSPKVYDLLDRYLPCDRTDCLFVSSNPFDVAGAKHAGLTVGWIQRGQTGVTDTPIMNASTMFRALRSHQDELGYAADFRLGSLLDLTARVAAA